MGQSLTHSNIKTIIENYLSSEGFSYLYVLQQHQNVCACQKTKDGVDSLCGIRIFVKDNRLYQNSIMYTLSQLYSDVPDRIDDKNEDVLKDEEKLKKLVNGEKMPKHVNIPKLLGVYESKKYVFVVLEYLNFSVRSLLTFNYEFHDEMRRRFMFYQLFHVIFFCHKSGFALGDLRPSDILVNDVLWIFFTGFSILYDAHHSITSNESRVTDSPRSRRGKDNMSLDLTRGIGQRVPQWDIESAKFSSLNTFQPGEKVIVPRSSGFFTYGKISSKQPPQFQKLRIYRIEITASQPTTKASKFYKDLPAMSIGQISSISTGSQIPRPKLTVLDAHNSICIKWQHGELSNFDYLMALNSMAGRRMGDYAYHPIMPWVIDFQQSTSNNLVHRDLTKSKSRLHKGDETLDHFFMNTEIPHHVTEPLSEIVYFMYLARRTPKSTLQKHIRKKFEPNEYPPSIQSLYCWSPEECIPEFYTNPEIFESIHEDLPDLSVGYFLNPKKFIMRHRQVLESDHVSKSLHHWIDLMFGFQLTGDAALEAKNVMLQNTNKKNLSPQQPGFVQLFQEPHPRRLCAYFPDHYLHVRNLQKFGSSNNGSSTPRNPIDDEDETNEKMSPFWLENLFEYERTVAFSAKNLHSPHYHMVPILLSQKSKKNIPQQELFADDMFALGCILAEMYTGKPLFSGRTMDLYIKGEYNPCLESVPQPARLLVKLLIDKNTVMRKNAFHSHHSQKMFPKYFKSAYNFLTQFYKAENKFEYVLSEIRFLKTTPTESFNLVFPHIWHALMSHKKDWINAIKILKELSRKVLQSEDESVHYSIISKINDLFDETDDADLQLLLFSHQIQSLTLRLMGTTQAQFLGKILPFYIEGIFHMSRFDVAKQACSTLCHVSKFNLGIVLSLQHIVEPIMSRIMRGNTTNPGRNKFAFYALLYLGLTHQPGTMLMYYTPKFLEMITDYISKNGHTNQDILNILTLLDRMVTSLHSPSAPQIVGKLLNSNIETFRKLFHLTNSMSIRCFQKFSQLVCHMLAVSSGSTKVSFITELNPFLSFIFQSDCNLVESINQGLKYVQNSDSSSQSKKKPLRSRIFRGLSISKSNNHNESQTDQLDNKVIFPQRPDEMNPISDSNFSLLKGEDLTKACCLYRELCCVFGNSTMSTAITNSTYLESFFQSKIVSNGDDEHDFLQEELPTWVQAEQGFEVFDQNNDDKSRLKERTELESMANTHDTSELYVRRNLNWWLSDKKNTLALLGEDQPMNVFEFNGILEHELMLKNDTIPRSFHSIDVNRRDERMFLTCDASDVLCWNIDVETPVTGFRGNPSRQVTKAKFIDSVNPHILICDGGLSLFDYSMGKMIHAFKPHGTILDFDIPRPHFNLFPTITSDSFVRFYDLRTHSNKAVYSWKLWEQAAKPNNPINPTPLIRCVSIQPHNDVLFLGLSNGVMYSMDLNSGLILDTFKAHEKDVVSIKPYSKDLVLSCSCGDRTGVRLWNYNDSGVSETKLVRSYLVNSPSQIYPPNRILSFDSNADNESLMIATASHFGYTGVHNIKQVIRGGKDDKPTEVFLPTWKPNLNGKNESISSVAMIPIHRLVLGATDYGKILILR